MVIKLINYISKGIKKYYREVFNIKEMTLCGVKVNLTHNNICPELRRFFYNESYEREEIEILQRYLSDEDMVMEIGAGIGFLSTFCAQKLGSDKVVAYEANPFMIDKIEETYRLNKVEPIIQNTLLTDKESTMDFYLEKNFWSSSTIKRSERCKCIEVATKDINKELKRFKPTFLIIDIEGGEKDLIPIINFDRINKIIIEIHPHVIGEYEASKIITYLISKRYSLNFKEMKGNVFMFEKIK